MALILTTHGEIEESLLVRADGEVNNDHEHTTWIEYRLGDELVHRSVHVRLKESVDLSSILQPL